MSIENKNLLENKHSAENNYSIENKYSTENNYSVETKKSYAETAKEFIETLPYRQGEYAGRNWGHPWHSLCSYHGKLKPAIAHFLVKRFTNKGDIVLDPLCGVGTIPFEACLQGRTGIGNDLSRMAYAVTKAKVEHPGRAEADRALSQLSDYIEAHKNDFNAEPPLYGSFGFNGKIPDYFHKDTYREILAARAYFYSRELSAEDAMVLSCFLHVLHGNRPYALSRNSHPLTPYKPTGEFIYKNVAGHISAKLDLAYKKANPEGMATGMSLHGDFSLLNQGLTGQVDEIITSPPFAGSIRFYIQNWMRLWCAGWEEKDFKQADTVFLEARQKKSMDVYYGFFDMCHRILKPGGKVILHLGNSKTCNMADELELRARDKFNIICKGTENVEALEKHGIKDKGATFEHQFIFLEKKGTSALTRS